ncbi:unnamed protein product [Caenorhabditis angaria]|uniref:Serpentine receptor class r-10 n=1 Tax=Caenorhabditis angaria TaxID=860376 RepID=A0A9P1J1G8_9PELO|nr:unnamed protein product [Caenorhabditis angaria]
MNGEKWLSLQHSVQYSSAILAVLMNGYQIFLITHKSPKTLVPYKYLIAYTSLFEILYTFFEVISSPIFYTYDSALIMLIDTRKAIFNPFIMSIFNSLYCGTFGAVLGLFSIQFIYRYLNTKKSRYLSSFKSWKIIFWCLIPFFSGSSWSLVVHFLASKDDSKDQYIRKNIRNDLNENINDIIYSGILIYIEDQNGVRHPHWISIFVDIFIIISLLISLAIIIYCGVFCYREVRQISKISKSKRTQSLQTQLFYALVVQTLIPLFLLHLPVSTVFLLVLFEKNIGIYGGIITMTIAIYPAIDPIPNFIIIKDYRKTTKSYINRLLLRNEQPKSENVKLPKLKF